MWGVWGGEYEGWRKERRDRQMVGMILRVFFTFFSLSHPEPRVKLHERKKPEMNSLLITFIASVLLSLSVTLAQESRTDRPIIGVVTLPFMGLAVAGGAARRRRLSAQNERPSSHHHHHHRHRHHDSDKEVKTMVDMAFAKWVMAAGARVAVIHYDLIADGCGHPNASMCEAGERKLRR